MPTTTITTDFLFSGAGTPQANCSIQFDSDGTIQQIGQASEAPVGSTHYPGAICPGFINAHIHTELSHLSPVQAQGSGMAEFIRALSLIRHSTLENERRDKITNTLHQLYDDGVSGAGDICNEHISFSSKKESLIKWHHFVEIFGPLTSKAETIIAKAQQLRDDSIAIEIKASITPHAPYSLSQKLFALLTEKATEPSDLLSIHFMESTAEIDLLTKRDGDLAVLIQSWGTSLEFIPPSITSPACQVIKNTSGQNRTMLVHNTFIDKPSILMLLNHFSDLWFCLCPSSNLTITNSLPPVRLLRSHSTKILIGTDSRASNEKLSMIEEIRLLQTAFPEIPLFEIIGWATKNGALFFNWDHLGTIAPGKTPGLIWLKGFEHPGKPLLKSIQSKRII